MYHGLKAELDWSSLGFRYVRTDLRFVSRWKNGVWDTGELVSDNQVQLLENACGIQYGQQCFEGLKAFMQPDGSVALFRPRENARRMKRSADRLLMATVPEELFLDACRQVVKANLRWVPPYGSGAAFYLRPLLIGISGEMYPRPADEYLFTVFGTPVGPYFRKGLQPVSVVVSEHDRSTSNGTGSVKAGGNYAGGFKAADLAKKKGYAECLYLDPACHMYVKEVGNANFFGITHTDRFVTPRHDEVFPSITLDSLKYLAERRLGMTVDERPIRIDALDQFVEAGAGGTAVGVMPIGGVLNGSVLHTFYSDGKEVGPQTRALHEELCGIQEGRIPAPEGWLCTA